MIPFLQNFQPVQTVGFALSSSLAEDHAGSRTLSHVHGGLRGLGSVATVFEGEQYRLLTGLGTMTLHVWNLIIYRHDDVGGGAGGSGTGTGASGEGASSLPSRCVSADWSCIMSKSVAGGAMFSEFCFLDNGRRALTRTR